MISRRVHAYAATTLPAALIASILLVVLSSCTPSATSGDDKWEDLLQDGNGNDWKALSDTDKTAFCLAAAKKMGKDDAVAKSYQQHLHDLYQRSNELTRSIRISAALNECQSLIDRGFIKVESSPSPKPSPKPTPKPQTD